MALFTWQATIQNDEGQEVASASIEVRSTATGTPLATLFSDDAGASLANPFTTGSDGFAQFWVAPGEYTIAATAGGQTRTWVVQFGDAVTIVDSAADFRADPALYPAGHIVSVVTPTGTVQLSAVATGGDLQTTSGQRWDVVSQTATPEIFGAAGDAVVAPGGTLTSGTDDAAAFGLLATWASAGRGRKVAGDASKTYLVNSEVAFTSDMIVQDISIFKNSNGPAIGGAAPFSFYNLTADYSVGDTSLAVADTGDALAPGTVIVIVSDSITPYNRDEGGSALQFRVAEYVTVGIGSTTTNIVMDRPLRRPFGIDPADANLSVGNADEPITDAFTTALNARIAVVDRRVADLRNVSVEYASGHGPGSGDQWGGDTITLEGYSGFVRGPRVVRGYDAGLSIIGPYSVTVENPTIDNLADDPATGAFGYGINNNSNGLRVLGGTFSNMRHAHKPGPNMIAANDRTYAAISQAGGEDFLVMGARASSCSHSAFDGHHGGFAGRYVHCYVEGCDSFAFGIRGRNIVIDSPVVRNCKGAFSIFTDFAGSSPNDDNWLAGKAAEYFTSARIINPDVECEVGDIATETNAPFYVRYATVSVEGRARVVANSHTLIHGNGIVDWDASTLFEVSNFLGAIPIRSADSRGVIHWVGGNNAQANIAFPNSVLRVGKGADIRVDMSSATGVSPTLINSSSGADVIIRGNIFAELGAGQRLLSGAGGIETPSGGLIEWFVDGAADNSITENAALFAANIEAVDGSAYWKAAQRTNELQMVFNDSTQTPIVGTGSEIANAYIPPLAATLDRMEADTAGHIRIRQVFRKTGSAGGATIKYDSFGAFMTQIVTASGDDLIILDADLFVTSATTFDFVFSWHSQNNTTRRTDGDSGTKTVSGGIGTAAGNALDLDPTIAVGDTVTIQSTQIWANVGGIL